MEMELLNIISSEVLAMGGINSIILLILGYLMLREAKHRRADQAKTDERDSLRSQESLLAIKLMRANMELGLVTASAVKDADKDGKFNEPMQAAIAAAKLAGAEYESFLDKLAANIKSEKRLAA
jgi:hypothetical protein